MEDYFQLFFRWRESFVILIKKEVKRLREINVKVNDPFLHEFPDLNVTAISAAIMQSQTNDVVKIPNGIWLTSPLELHDVRLKIDGEQGNQSIIRIPDDENFLVLGKNVQLTVSNCTIVVGDQARFLMILSEHTGRILLKNVTVLYENEYDSLSSFCPVIETQSIPEKGRRLFEFQRCKLPYVFIYASKVKARYAMIGDMIKNESFIHVEQVSQFKNCWLHHLRFIFQNKKEKCQFRYIKTTGDLVIQGSSHVHSLDVVDYQSNYKEKIERIQEIKGIQLAIDHELFTLPSLLLMHHQRYPSYALIFEPLSDEFSIIIDGRIGLETKENIAFCRMKNIALTFKDTTIPKFVNKSLVENGSITMIRTVDDNLWRTSQTVINLEESDSTLIKTIQEQLGVIDAGIEPVTLSNKQSIHRTALAQLDAMIGLQSAKETIHKMVAIAKLNKERERRGMESSKDYSLHTVFLGNAGVGKTTVARLYAKALHENDLLKKDSVREVTSKDLIAGYVGQTRPLVHQVILESLDGVLFIDEAYSLGQKNDEFASQAVDQLIADMENYRDRLVVILAGYTGEMKDLLANANPGLRSRFTNLVMFEDYSEGELLQIFGFQINQQKAHAQSNDAFVFAKKGLVYLYRYMKKQGAKSVGNARFVRNYVQMILIARDNRLAKTDLLSIQDDYLLAFTQDDVKYAVAEMKKQGRI